MRQDLTKGNITKTMLLFAVPMILGNLLQQLYNIADTLIVGKVLGANALAAVGAAYTLMSFLTSVLLGLCMGSGAVFSIQYGQKNWKKLKSSIAVSFGLILLVTIVINVLVFVFIDPIIVVLQVPEELYQLMRAYLWIIFMGIGFTFIYNYFASLLRAVGNSVVPLVYLAVSAVMNIALDIIFVMVFHWGVSGAASATVIAQGFSAAGIALHTWIKFPELRIGRAELRFEKNLVREISQYSVLTCVQQSVMNFGILMIQGLVNSFGTIVMAAFAAAVKIDSFAYMPVQDFGNAFSTFVAQNYGAGEQERIRDGIKSAVRTAIIFCVIVSTAVFVFAKPLMLIFVQPHETEILAVGVQYLRIEGAFYCGIGCLFLLYGFYRAIEKPGMSVVLTVISLGTRVLLAYLLAPIERIGVVGIWAAIPIGWFLADMAGLIYYKKWRKTLLNSEKILEE